MIRLSCRAAAAIAVLALGLSAVCAAEITGTVVRVTSGDTLVIRDGEREVEVRLADIGAPQGSQYYAPASQTLLSNMVSGQPVRVTVTGAGGPDRVFGRVTVGELKVNLELVRRGAAWVCWEYATDTDYAPYEQRAQRLKLGLWGGTWLIDARVDCRRRPPAERPVSGS